MGVACEFGGPLALFNLSYLDPWLGPSMKFSIRDLFLVTLIVAHAVGWWVSQRNYAIREQRLKDEHARSLDKQRADYARHIDELTNASLTTIKNLTDDFKRPGFYQPSTSPKRIELPKGNRTYTLPGPPAVPNPPAGF